MASIASFVAAYFALGAFVRAEFRDTALQTVAVVEQDIRFAVSVAPMICVVDKYKNSLNLKGIDNLKRSLNVVLSRAIPETKTIVNQINAYNSETQRLQSKAKSLLSNSQDTLRTIDNRISDFRQSSGFLKHSFPLLQVQRCMNG